MVRKSQNQILGPFSKADLCRMIREGELNLQDEVCQANGYWISLHEQEEVKKHLGIEVPRQRRNQNRSDDDITETDSGEAADDGPTDPDLDSSGVLSHSLKRVFWTPLEFMEYFEYPWIWKGMIGFLVIVALGLMIALLMFFYPRFLGSI